MTPLEIVKTAAPSIMMAAPPIAEVATSPQVALPLPTSPYWLKTFETTIIRPIAAMIRPAILTPFLKNSFTKVS